MNLAIERWLRQYQRNGIKSARTFAIREFRARMLQRAYEPPSRAAQAKMRQTVKADLARAERRRLDQLARKRR